MKSGADIELNDVNPDTLTANGLAMAFGTITLGNAGYVIAADVAKNSTCAWSSGNSVLTITVARVALVRPAPCPVEHCHLPAERGNQSATGEAIDTAQTPRSRESSSDSIQPLADTLARVRAAD